MIWFDLWIFQQEVPVDWGLADYRDKLISKPYLGTNIQYIDIHIVFRLYLDLTSFVTKDTE